MEFLNGKEEVFKTAITNEKPTIAMLIANGCMVEDIDGRVFEECTYSKHTLKDNKGYGELIIRVREVR